MIWMGICQNLEEKGITIGQPPEKGYFGWSNWHHFHWDEVTDIIICVVEALQSDWPTPRPDLKGRQHSNKKTCPWIVPAFYNTKLIVEKKTKQTETNISVEVDNSKLTMSINEVESTTTYVAMKYDTLKDDIAIDTT